LSPILNQSAIFVGSVVGFLNVLKYTPPVPPSCRLDIIFDLELVLSPLVLKWNYLPVD